MLRRDDSAAAKIDTNPGEVHTILGQESSFEGKLAFDGTVRIDGEFKGEVYTKDALIIGQSAKIAAQIHVGSIVIHGEVVGDIVARQSVAISAPGKVRGNIQTPELTIAKGVVFEGYSRMEEAGTLPINAEASSTPAATATLTLLSGQKEAP